MSSKTPVLFLCSAGSTVLYVTSALSRRGWIDCYCLEWRNGQQFFQCCGLDPGRQGILCFGGRRSADVRSVGVVRNLILSLQGFRGSFWCPQCILPPLLSMSLMHNAADRFLSSSLAPDMDDERASCHGNVITEATGAQIWDWRGFVGEQKTHLYSTERAGKSHTENSQVSAHNMRIKSFALISLMWKHDKTLVGENWVTLTQFYKTLWSSPPLTHSADEKQTQAYPLTSFDHSAVSIWVLFPSPL